MIRIIDGETGRELEKIDVKNKEHKVKKQVKRNPEHYYVQKKGKLLKDTDESDQERSIVDQEKFKYKSMINESTLKKIE